MTAVEGEVRAFNDAYERALADQDAEALIALYREDARIMSPGQPVLQGRDAVAPALRAWVRSGPVAVQFVTEEVIARAISSSISDRSSRRVVEASTSSSIAATRTGA